MSWLDRRMRLYALGISCAVAVFTVVPAVARGDMVLAGVGAGLALTAGMAGLLLLALHTLVTRELPMGHKRLLANVAAGHELHALLQGRPLPPLARGWRMELPVMADIVRIIDQTAPQVIVELGPGASTELIADLIRRRGLNAHLYSIEHNLVFLDALTARLPEDAPVTITHAELVPTQVGVWNGEWYDQSALSEAIPQHIDLLIVDGPPGPNGPQARFPAVPVLSAQLNYGAYIVLDDTARPDERTIVDVWCQLPGISVVATDINHTVLRFTASSADVAAGAETRPAR